MTDFDCAVIGAGAVGLACAAAFAQAGASVVVLEADKIPGSGNSSRNSEVIHAGLYYPTGSLKHRLCVDGRRLLYAFLDDMQVPYSKCGKLVVATTTDEEVGTEQLLTRAQTNGVEGVALLSSDAVSKLEPEVDAVSALWSPETGIFDSHSYMLALIAQIEAAEGIIVYRSPVERIVPQSVGFDVLVGGAEPCALKVGKVINSAGLKAPDIARATEGLAPEHIPEQWMAKGSYFGLVGRGPFSRLIYPAPVDGGLGVHSTLDLSGRIRFGPDVEWLSSSTAPDQVAYEVDADRAESFYAAIRRYWPGLSDGALVPDYAGCRPKLSAPGEPPADFDLQFSATHGLPGLVNLFGIESPGLTASLAIAQMVQRQS